MKPSGEKATNLIRDKYRKAMQVCILLLSCILTLTAFHFLETYDNKYSHYSIQPQKGILEINQDTFSNGNYICIIDDWEFYRNNLIISDPGASRIPDYVFIGQYSDYSMRNIAYSPFGKGSYRLVIRNTSDPQIVSLQLPELFSACNVYINGELVSSLGNVSEKTYSPFIQNQILSFPVSGDTELVIEVTNFSHYYSGMFYPPIIGATPTITYLVLWNYTFYGILCISTITIAFFTLVVWRNRYNSKLFSSFGLLCLSFGIHISYPFIRWLGVPSVNLFYAIEDASEYVMISCCVLITANLCGHHLKPYFKKILFPVTVGMGVFTFFVPMFLLPALPKLLIGYGKCIDFYQVSIGLYMVGLGCMALYKKKQEAILLLCGNVIFGVGILKDVFTSNMFEPIRGGWLKEYTCFALVVIFSIMIQRYINSMVEQNQHLTDNLEQEVSDRTRELTALLDERKKLLSEAAHDLKAPISSILTFVEFIQLGGVRIDDETSTYLEIIEQKSNEAKDRVATLQKLMSEDSLDYQKERVCINEFLQEFYENNYPDAEANGIYFYLHVPERLLYMDMDKDKIMRALENILYNDFDFTPMEGSITITLSYEDKIIIEIQDTGKGIPQEDLPYIFQRDYSRREGDSPVPRGLGLQIAQKIVQGHQGSISVTSRLGKGTTFSIIFAVRQRN